MDDQDRSARLAALWNAPSEDNFHQIWQLFMRWPDGADKDAALQDAVTRLETWDDELRHISSLSEPLYRDNRVSPMGRLVRSLGFHRRDEGTGDLVRIADSPNAEGLRRLTIFRCDITGQGIVGLARSQYLNNLTHLKFVDTYFPPGTAQELLRTSQLPRLASLELIDCSIKDDDVAALQHAPLAARLKHLSLADNLLNDESARLLAQAPTLDQLDTLDLSKNGISEAAAQALRAAPHLARTRILT